jgi:hypothetical protein
MNGSISRVGLAVATFAVIVTVGGAYVADGYLSAQGAASAIRATPTINDSSSPSPTATLPPELVYVRPAPSPKVIHITKAAPAAAPKVIHVTVPTVPGESADGERDSGGGD